MSGFLQMMQNILFWSLRNFSPFLCQRWLGVAGGCRHSALSAAALKRNYNGRLGMMRTIGRKNFVELWKLLQHNSVKIFWVLDSVWGGSKSSCHKVKWIMNEALWSSVMNCLHWMSELFICLLGSYFVQHAVKRNFFLEPECWCCGPDVLWPRRCAAGLASLRDEPISDHSPSLLLPVTVRNTIICALTHTKTDSKWKKICIVGRSQVKNWVGVLDGFNTIGALLWRFLRKSLLSKKASAPKAKAKEEN